MKNKISIVSAILFLFWIAVLNAAVPEVVLQNLKGKVEVRLAGTTAWLPAAEGQLLGLSSTLSTGFDSSAVIVMGKTSVQVHPLTRITIDKLVEEAGTVKTTTFLRVGSLSASVKSADGVKQDFKVQSPYTTASVRGTEFDYDGLHLKVREGVVSFEPGRPTRETPPGSHPEQAADFIGAPAAADDPAKAVAVPAGQSAVLSLGFPGQPPKINSSGDPQSLNNQGPAPLPPPPPKPTVQATPSPPLTVTGSIQ